MPHTRPPVRTPLACLIALPLLGACAGNEPVPMDCVGLANNVAAGTTLAVEPVPGGTTRPTGVTTGEFLAEHCRVSGAMNARTGTDGKPYETRFELRLPSHWNGRFLYQGGGGNDGVVNPAIGRQATPSYALNRGFAVVSTDAGHQGATPEFGLDATARVDHAYAAHDRVATTAKGLIERFYLKPPERSYFVGCSGGGRQGMMFSQRFPGYFDGILAMAPAMTVAKGASIAAAWDSQVFNAIAPRPADAPILAQSLPAADRELLRNGILAACDAQDGLADGLVSKPGCSFDPAVLQCAGAKTASCLSAEQVGALKKALAGPRNTAGQALYHPWPWDAGIGHPANDWAAWKIGTSTTAVPNSRHVTLMQGAIGYEFFTPAEPAFSIFNFNFDTDPARMDAFAAIYNTAADATLAAFKSRNGKLLLAHGMADGIFSPNESIDYYQRLQAANGANQDLARLFLIPGMGHCQGGAATDVWDGLGALVDWVEKGSTPARIVANGSTVYPNRSRPLCAYPTYAQYNGTGDSENAASFSCKAP